MNQIINSLVDILTQSSISINSDSRDIIIDQFRSVNKSGLYTIAKLGDILVLHGRNYAYLFVLDCTDSEKEVSNSQIYNMNVNSGYKVTIDGDGVPRCNLFFNHKYLYQDYTKMNETDTGRFLLNLRYVYVNLLRYAYPMIKEQFLNIAAAVCAVVTANKIALPINPTIIAHYLEVTPAMAEAILDKYDYEKDDFVGIPWLF